jgi:hypothetical protein
MRGDTLAYAALLQVSHSAVGSNANGIAKRAQGKVKADTLCSSLLSLAVSAFAVAGGMAHAVMHRSATVFFYIY